MADILGLTTSEKVRSQLGASLEELSEQILLDLELDSELKVDLYEWFPDYAALIADNGSTTETDIQLSALKAYSRLFCALKVTTLVPMRFLQKKADGDNQGVRYNHKDTINNLKEDLINQMAEKRNSVLSIDTNFSPTSKEEVTSVPIIGISVPSTDKITGV